MLYATPIAGSGSPHVVVVGNEKGGSGKTTMAMHLAVALLKNGQRVGTIDLDSSQRALTRYIQNRRIWANYRQVALASSRAPRAPSSRTTKPRSSLLSRAACPASGRLSISW